LRPIYKAHKENPSTFAGMVILMKPAWLTYSFICFLFVSLLVMQLACGMGASAPMRPANVPATPVAAPTAAQVIELPPAITEIRMLTLEFPPKIRAGDSDVVRLTLEVDDNGNLTPTVLTEGNVTRGEVIIIPNLYDSHNILAEARLDMAGVDIRPSETISETLLPRQKITFYWSVLPADVGRYKGTVWFYLRFIPKASGMESRQALSAQTIEIEATTFFGLRANPARWLGIAGTFISSVLGLPFLETILKWLWKRLRG
jgi:hypothetical protein